MLKRKNTNQEYRKIRKQGWISKYFNYYYINLDLLRNYKINFFVNEVFNNVYDFSHKIKKIDGEYIYEDRNIKVIFDDEKIYKIKLNKLTIENVEDFPRYIIYESGNIFENLEKDYKYIVLIFNADENLEKFIYSDEFNSFIYEDEIFKKLETSEFLKNEVDYNYEVITDVHFIEETINNGIRFIRSQLY